MPNQLEPPPRSAVSRITAILSTFLTGGSHSVTEMARLTGLPVSTTHRIAVDLASWQLLHRTADGQYRVGIILRQLGGEAWSMPVLTERGPHVVTDLCEATRRRARLGVLENGRVAYIEKRVGGDPVTPFGAVGHAAGARHGGRQGAAGLRAAGGGGRGGPAADRLHPAHPAHRGPAAAGAGRSSGSPAARWRYGELVPGESAVAVPVFGCGGEVIAALEVELHDLRADLELCKAALAVAARGLSRELAVDHDRVDRPRLRLLPASDGAAAPL